MAEPILITDISIATQQSAGLIADGTLVIEGQNIAWVGAASDCPTGYNNLKTHSFSGRLLTPGLIDCHTHIVHGGERAMEFEMRLNGASYAEVARAGGGIVATVSATRAADQVTLLRDALARVDALIAEGVTTVEIKSGYGLDHDTELKMLRVARQIASERPIHVVTTFLGAHAVPAGMNADSYIDTMCIPALNAAHGEGLVDAVDGFCEGIAFDADQMSRVFKVAKSLGLPIKLHAEQLSHCGGTELATRFDALSVDHLEYASDDDAALMAKSGSVAVLLPGAFYTLREVQAPPVAAFRAHNVPMAVATDWNPGSSPLGSLLLAMNMACTLFQLTPAEALAGTTCNAARALGLPDRGILRAGMRSDLAVWDVASPAELSYRIASNPLHTRIFAGQFDPT